MTQNSSDNLPLTIVATAQIKVSINLHV